MVVTHARFLEFCSTIVKANGLTISNWIARTIEVQAAVVILKSLVVSLKVALKTATDRPRPSLGVATVRSSLVRRLTEKD